MSDRPTPETDAFSGNLGDCIKFAEKLERQRDEAREQANVMHEQWLSKGRCCENLAEELHEVKQQRDEAREALKKIKHVSINGGDTYLDFVKVSNIATDYLEGL